MNVNKLYFAPECFGTQIELVDVTADFYGAGRERQAEPVGYRYAVLLREHAAERLTVKILGTQQMETPVSGTGVMVEFKNLKVRPYINRATGQMAYTAVADAIMPAQAEKAKQKDT